MRFFLLAGLSIILASPATSLAKEHEHRHHNPHIHGVGYLNLVMEGSTIMVELQSPAANIVGFEHIPKTDSERNKMQEAKTLLNDGDTLFVFSKEAGCSQTQASISSPLFEEKHHHQADNEKHDHHGDQSDHGAGHGDIFGQYLFSCKSPDKVKAMEVNLFSAFSGFEEVKLQALASDGQQRGAELTAGNNLIEL